MQSDIPVYINYGLGRFLPMLQQFGQFLQTVPLASFNVTRQQDPVGVIVSPRNNSGIPFCNLTLALMYVARGYPVTIIWDDLEFLDPEWDTQKRCIDLLVKAICDHTPIKFVQLSTVSKAALDAEDHLHLKKLASHNAIWNVRNVVPTDALDHYSKLSFDTMVQHAGRIKQLYTLHQFDHCVHQSLVNNNGGLHKYFGNQAGQRVSCIDIAGGKGLIGLNDVHGYFYDLLHLQDPDSFFHLFGDDQYREAALELARNTYELRLFGKDDRSTQPTSEETESIGTWDIVIPMNIFWDAAALGRNRLFESPYSWLVQTISHILFNTPFSVALRQHPHEKNFLNQFETGTLLGTALLSRFEGHPRFKFISCTDPINTYHLIETCNLVLPFTSTVGIEAALMGKQVIVASDVYYANEPFVSKAQSVEDYFKQISESTPTDLSENAEQRAWLFYFLVTQTPYLHLPFGLDPADVQQWCQAGFEALNTHPTIQDAINCLATNTPFSFVNGKRILDETIAKKEKSHDQDPAYHPRTFGRRRRTRTA